MSAMRRIVSTFAGGAVVCLALYGFWIRGYSPLIFPQQLAWDAFKSVSSYAHGSEKVWMVVDFTAGGSRSAQMAFNNPSAPELSLADCQAAIPQATPNLLDHIRQTAGDPSATITAVHCVESASDPIKP